MEKFINHKKIESKYKNLEIEVYVNSVDINGTINNYLANINLIQAHLFYK